MTTTKYRTTVITITFQGKSIPVENSVPEYTPEEEQAVRGELEQQLYSIFKKYLDSKMGTVQ